ncbi:MAG TPA: hypothetical protein VFR49_09095, partial [Solirubrobacteraceae bacterium]|nr:hypothetical protein [Solirubrobacteraceae bacterium]
MAIERPRDGGSSGTQPGGATPAGVAGRSCSGGLIVLAIAGLSADRVLASGPGAWLPGADMR